MENFNLDLYIYNIKIEADKRSKFIDDYQPFIIKTVSELKNGYVNVENDDEYSIGLLAFDEAIERFDSEKGHFLPYARLIIESRLKNYWVKEGKHVHSQLEDDQVIAEPQSSELASEIYELEKELALFGLDFDILAEHSPKHIDTLKRAKEISRKISRNGIIMSHLYEKKRLPISLISRTFGYSQKIIKGNKLFIIAGSIIFYKNYELLKEWIK